MTKSGKRECMKNHENRKMKDRNRNAMLKNKDENISKSIDSKKQVERLKSGKGIKHN